MARETTQLHRLAGASAPVLHASSAVANNGTEFTTLPSIGYIRNPRSHRNKGNAETAKALSHVSMAEPKTKAELEAALAEFARQGIGMLAIGGGDGTVRDVLTRGAPLFGDDWPPLVLLPKGKTNALAVDLGLPRQWSLDQALEAVRRGRVVRRRPLLIEQVSGEGRARYGFIFGAGAFNAAVDAGQVAHRHGAFQSFAVGMTAAFGILQALFGFGEGPWRRITPMSVTEESGDALPHSHAGPAAGRFLAGFTTLQKFPLGLRPFAGIPAEAGPIRYFFLDAPLRRAVALVPAAALGWRSRLLTRLGMHRGAGEGFLMDLDGDFILDGEHYPPGNYRIHAGPEIKFVVP